MQISSCTWTMLYRINLWQIKTNSNHLMEVVIELILARPYESPLQWFELVFICHKLILMLAPHPSDVLFLWENWNILHYMRNGGQGSSKSCSAISWKFLDSQMMKLAIWSPTFATLDCPMVGGTFSSWLPSFFPSTQQKLFI